MAAHTQDETAKLPAGWLAVTEARIFETQALIAVLTFVIVASGSVIAPVLGNLLLGQGATSSLVALRRSRERPYAMITVIVLLIG